MTATTVDSPPVKLGQWKETPQGDFRVPDEDFYIMEFVGWDAPVKSRYIDEATGEYPYRINLKFTVVSDLQGDLEFEGAKASNFFGLDLNPNAKGSILHVLRALDPTEEPEPGTPLDPYKGKRLIGEIVHKTQPSNSGDGTTVTFANVGGVKPLKKQRKAAATESETPKRNPLLDDEE